MNLDHLTDKQHAEFERRVKKAAREDSTGNVDAVNGYISRIALRDMTAEAVVATKHAIRAASWSGFAQEPMAKMMDLLLLLSAEIG